MKDHFEVLKTVCELAGTKGDKAQVPDYEGANYHDEKAYKLMKKGKLPKAYLREDSFEEYDGVSKPFHDYKLSCGMDVLHEVLFMDERAVRDKLDEVKSRDMPNLPSDGSKGQWKVAQQGSIEMLEWLLDQEGDN